VRHPSHLSSQNSKIKKWQATTSHHAHQASNISRDKSHPDPAFDGVPMSVMSDVLGPPPPLQVVVVVDDVVTLLPQPPPEEHHMNDY